jgi:hypothetical protein
MLLYAVSKACLTSAGSSGSGIESIGTHTSFNSTLSNLAVSSRTAASPLFLTPSTMGSTCRQMGVIVTMRLPDEYQ